MPEVWLIVYQPHCVQLQTLGRCEDLEQLSDTLCHINLKTIEFFMFLSEYSAAAGKLILQSFCNHSLKKSGVKRLVSCKKAHSLIMSVILLWCLGCIAVFLIAANVVIRVKFIFMINCPCKSLHIVSIFTITGVLLLLQIVSVVS